MKNSTSEFLTLRGRRMHQRLWGPADAPKILMVHGWGDTSASYQFVVDALRGRWRVQALDWRGFGQSQWNDSTYWFPDYFADLEAWLDHVSPGEPVRLVGHSMGATIASIYAGVRPERIARLANLDGGGLRIPSSQDAPKRIRTWLDQLRVPARFRAYPDHAAFAARLMRDNPRLRQDRAEFLAREVTLPCEGGVKFAMDPTHHWLNPVYFSVEDAKAAWREVSAPVLLLGAQQSFVTRYQEENPDEFQARKACYRDLRYVMLEDCGHNMHHDQPERVAQLIEEFFA